MSPKKRRLWSVNEKLEVVRARQKGLSPEDILSLYGISHESLYRWSKAYDEKGIMGLESAWRRKRGASLSPKVRAAENMVDGLVTEYPAGGIGRIQGALYRHGFLGLARETVRRLLMRKKKNHPVAPRRRGKNKPYKARKFERSRPNELWQTDIMGFMLKGQYRVYLIGFMDDYSRFMVGWGLYRFQTTANVMEVFRGAIEKHGLPKEVLSDNGRQYYTWRGSNKFSKMLVKFGIRHIRSRPYHPQTLGKIESFWRNLMQECLTQTPLSSFEEAQGKIGEYIEYYNFKRPHQGIENLIPSDRYFSVDGQVKELIQENMARVADQGSVGVKDYKKPTYLVGNLGGQELRLIAKDAKVSLEKPVEEMVQSAGNAEENPGNTTEKPNEDKESKCKSAEREEPAGVAACGHVWEEGREGVVPGSRDIAGAVLPVDETVKEAGAEDIGGGRTRPVEESWDGVPPVSGTGGNTGDEGICAAEEAPEGEEGGGAPASCGEDGEEDNKEAGMGTVA